MLASVEERRRSDGVVDGDDRDVEPEQHVHGRVPDRVVHEQQVVGRRSIDRDRVDLAGQRTGNVLRVDLGLVVEVTETTPQEDHLLRDRIALRGSRVELVNRSEGSGAGSHGRPVSAMPSVTSVPGCCSRRRCPCSTRNSRRRASLSRASRCSSLDMLARTPITSDEKLATSISSSRWTAQRGLVQPVGEPSDKALNEASDPSAESDGWWHFGRED